MLRNDQTAIVLAGSSSSSSTLISDSHTQYQEQENNEDDDDDEQSIIEIHALTPPPQRPPSSLSLQSSVSSENFTTMSREFNALVLAGSTTANHGSEKHGTNNSSSNNNTTNNNNTHRINSMGRIGEEDYIHGEIYDDNPLAIVPDHNPLPSPSRNARVEGGSSSNEVSVLMVKKEEVESKINAWQTAKIAKINNRFKREDAVISGLENEEVQKPSSWMKKVEYRFQSYANIETEGLKRLQEVQYNQKRKLEMKRARALEKMQNDIAKARRKAEEKRASAEAKRGTKVAKVMEIANLMRAVGRPPVKRSFF